MTTDEMIALLRFRRLDMRNSTPMACEALMGQAADEIKRLRKIENAARNYIGVMFLSDHQPGEALAKLHDLVEGYADVVLADGECHHLPTQAAWCPKCSGSTRRGES
jgi:hypothetical protein